MQGDKKPLHQVKNIALQLWDAPATCPQRPIARNLQGKFFFKQKFSLQQRIEKYKTMKEKVNSEDQVLIIAEVAGDLLKLSSQKYKIMSCNKSYNIIIFGQKSVRQKDRDIACFNNNVNAFIQQKKQCNDKKRFNNQIALVKLQRQVLVMQNYG